jgi:hypothetical protein
MAHRIQITLTDSQYAFLDDEADHSSVSIAELVRRAIDTTYALAEPPRIRVIEHSTGRRAGRRIDAARSQERRWLRLI